MATDFKGAVARGSNGGPARYLSTVGKSHVSLSVLGLAVTTKIPFKRVERSEFEDTVDPSEKPWCIAAMADLYPAKVDGAKGFPLCGIDRRFSRNSATSVRRFNGVHTSVHTPPLVVFKTGTINPAS